MGADEFDSAYPRRGQYGHTGQRCKWCGRHTSKVTLLGVYCTGLCVVADYYAIYFCFELFLVIIAVLFFWMLSLGTLPSSRMLETIVISVVLVALPLWQLRRLTGARKMRKKSGLWH